MKYKISEIQIPKYIVNKVHNKKVTEESYNKYMAYCNLCYKLYLANRMYYDEKLEKQINVSFYYLVPTLNPTVKLQPNKGYISKRGIQISILNLIKKHTHGTTKD